MSKYIKEHSLSVGYNNTGQEFFDMLYMYEKYIHSYFFSLTDRLEGDIFNEKTAKYFAEKLVSCDTYNFSGNMLFNNIYSFEKWEEMFNMVIDKINIKSVTVLYPEWGIIIKEKYPDLEIHLSVRFWDWKLYEEKYKTYEDTLKNMIGNIDVINISGSFHYNNFIFIEKCKELGFKTKFIVNEGCIVNRDKNYSLFPGFENKKCWGETQNSVCKTNCALIRKEYPWMELSTVDIYKESLKYYENIDILKLACRFNDLKYINNLLMYWISDAPTSFIRGFNIPKEKYKIFLEYLEIRSKCSNDCFHCRKCERFYNELKGD